MISSTLPISVLIASEVGILFNALFIAGNYAVSFIAIPAIALPEPGAKEKKDSDKPPQSLTPVSHLIRQWFYVFHAGLHTMPPLAMVSALSFVYCLVRTWNLFYVLSIFGSVGIVPYTYRFMGAVNGELLKRTRALGIDDMRLLKDLHVERGETGLGHMKVEDLVAKWGFLGGLRVSFPMGGIIVTAIIIVWSIQEAAL